jgi:hypothetical protein
MVPNQEGVGADSMSASIGASRHFNAEAAQIRDFIGRDIVMFVSSLEEFLCAPIYDEGQILCVERKVMKLYNSLKDRKRFSVGTTFSASLEGHWSERTGPTSRLSFLLPCCLLETSGKAAVRGAQHIKASIRRDRSYGTSSLLSKKVIKSSV